MNTAHRIIDCLTYQTKRRNCRFADICHPPDECAQSLNCQSVHPRKHSARASSAPETSRALLPGKKTSEWCSRNVSSTNDRHSRFNTCAAAKPRPPP
jgi:hypothetical protein